LGRRSEFEAVGVSGGGDEVLHGLVDVTVELSIVEEEEEREEEGRCGTLDARHGVESDTARCAVTRAFGSLGRVLTVSDVFLMKLATTRKSRRVSRHEQETEETEETHVRVRVRVAEVNSIDAEAASIRDAATAMIGYHCFRGRVTAETVFFVRSNDETKLQILNNRGKSRSVRMARREIIRVRTRDGEMFPVHKSLLRGCIALTGAVRRAGDLSEEEEEEEEEEEAHHEDDIEDGTQDRCVRVEVNIDTDVFDRVLIFLEAKALKTHTPRYDIRITETLSVAAETLGCRMLKEYCAERLGAYESRIREYDWAEVCAHNSAGGVWLVIDGMVLDVKRWLPEHPGGDVIIPTQSLGLDAARHFEMYHSSRESFLYLKEFYIGEVRDKRDIPLPQPGASDDFLRQLRAYTTFRVRTNDETHVHLGQ